MAHDDLSKLLLGSIAEGRTANFSFTLSGEEALELLRRVFEYGRSEGAREQEEKLRAQENDKYISYIDAKALLSKSDSTLWNWDKKGLLRKIRRGGRVFYRLADVKKIMSGSN